MSLKNFPTMSNFQVVSKFPEQVRNRFNYSCGQPEPTLRTKLDGILSPFNGVCAHIYKPIEAICSEKTFPLQCI